MIAKNTLKIPESAQMSRGMLDAIEITTKVQLRELETWELPSYKLIQLLSFLPSLNTIAAVNKLWTQYKMKN